MSNPFITQFADVFEHAAELIASGNEYTRFCCHAISDAASYARGDTSSPEVDYFIAVIKPRNPAEATTDERRYTGDGVNVGWWHQNSQFYGDTTPENQQARILGLLLCAELAREGYEP